MFLQFNYRGLVGRSRIAMGQKPWNPLTPLVDINPSKYGQASIPPHMIMWNHHNPYPKLYVGYLLGDQN